MEEHQLSDRLRAACTKLRTSSMSLSDLIPLLQQSADAIDALRTTNRMDANDWAELYLLREDRGPDGMTWKAAAVKERIMRLRLEQELKEK